MKEYRGKGLGRRLLTKALDVEKKDLNKWYLIQTKNK